ncbi:MAG: hypothetical protein J6Y47_03860, partial [Bacteroidales bacterium]|nr:hypothetical protein [Bacteroidales bacterium]
MCAIKKGILSLFFIICCILNSAAQDFTGFALIKLDFYDDRDPRRTQINRCTLQNGFIIDIALYNNYLVPFNKKDRIHLIKTTDISLPTNIEEAIETKQECRKKYYPRELGQQAPYKEFFEWCLSYRYCSEINPTIEIPLPNNRKHNLCEGDRLPISNYRLDDKNIIMERQILQISEYESNNWKNLDYNYDGNGVSFEDLSTFIDKEFKKSIYNNRFKVRIEYAGYHSNEPDFIYFSQAMPNGTITLTDNHIEIPITPKQSISIAQSITETLYENLERQNNTVTGNLYFGHHTIIIEEDNTCPATYYANIMKATYNYIQDKVDFWSEEHTKRDDAIILHSYSKKNESEKYKPTNPNLKFITSTDSYICALTDEGQNCETEAADSQYYLTGCTYNKKEQQVT